MIISFLINGQINKIFTSKNSTTHIVTDILTKQQLIHALCSGLTVVFNLLLKRHIWLVSRSSFYPKKPSSYLSDYLGYFCIYFLSYDITFRAQIAPLSPGINV